MKPRRRGAKIVPEVEKFGWIIMYIGTWGKIAR